MATKFVRRCAARAIGKLCAEWIFVEIAAEERLRNFGARRTTTFPHGPETSSRDRSYMVGKANSRR
ncbi:hypothetical protein [Methylocystis heyeri]|uniref:Uncharacterized protein n=1 Tax=Methylocystis heyeri TaxID=391905 RepID=A0A6B8KKR8_9HYPH|nr:hypothetical protein [Methylocystis heyeri]QGM47505.1 hypothetical protein H2LOC_018445 [Methylocystis heyeri]